MKENNNSIVARRDVAVQYNVQYNIYLQGLFLPAIKCSQISTVLFHHHQATYGLTDTHPHPSLSADLLDSYSQRCGYIARPAIIITYISASC